MVDHHYISRLVELKKQTLIESVVSQIEQIFFESSSKKTFESLQEKNKFKYKYLGNYMTRYPEYFHIALAKTDSKSYHVLGYICGCPSTYVREALEASPYLTAFSDEFDKYPCHLHINCHQDSRGLGVGAKLLSALESQLKQEKKLGLHIITSSDARNVSFYERNGFIKRVRHGQLLLMAKDLVTS